MHEALFKMSDNKTIIAITHRLDYLNKYDKIILLEDGKIVEEGGYSELINNSTGKFRKFIESQQINAE